MLWHLTKIYSSKVFLLTKIKPEYSDTLYNPTYFPDPLVCRIRQIALYKEIDDEQHFFMDCNKNSQIRITLKKN
jgi:hypothetical protein